MIDKYTKLFALVLPITSILLIPQIQGTTPGLVMALFSPFIVLSAKKNNNRYYWHGIIVFVVLFLIFLFASQLTLIFGGGGQKGDLILIRPGPLEPMRVTIITQGLYLASGYLTFILFAAYYSKEWDGFIIAGGLLLATIGVAEWSYFLATGNDFGFISNRTFGEGLEGSGSAVQRITLMGRTVLRLKSLTGEPSMYALTVFPFMVFCIARRKLMIGAYFLITLLLSTSTAALLAFVVFGLMMIIFFTKGIASKMMYFTLLLLFFGALTLAFKDVLGKMVVEKLMLENVSGFDRFYNIRYNFEYWLKSNLAIKLFGIGWGTIRSTDMIMTLLINSGLFGLVAWMYLFLKPTIKIVKKDRTAFVLNLGMITVLIMLLVAVSEYAYLTTWMFLGILYNITNSTLSIDIERECSYAE
ncbi:MAG: hypothetical protein PHP53_24480 [Prolixibacteraceae bacterium]|nr:hypothetical protein [Prolixibacteraceae bacterium]